MRRVTVEKKAELKEKLKSMNRTFSLASRIEAEINLPSDLRKKINIQTC